MADNLPPSTDEAPANLSTANTESQPKRPNPRAVITAGCKAGSIDEVSRGLRLASNAPSNTYLTILDRALSSAVSNGHAPLTEYLISQENASMGSLYAHTVSMEPSPELISVLISYGWDINKRLPDRGDGKGKRLLDFILSDEALVRWCLDHGALVEDDPEASWYTSPPLLENAAALGSLSTFKLLHERGAVLGRMTLHRAVGSAATSEDLDTRMEVVKYLIDELKLDVNQMDREGKVADNWGPPICYAAKSGMKGGKEVTRFLLERGADPTIKDSWGNHDAFNLAEFNKCDGILEVLREWKEQKQSGV